MKQIVCSNSVCQRTMRSWKRTLEFTNSISFRFLPFGKPIIDVFDEWEPDVFICTENDITRGLYISLLKFRNTKVLLYNTPGLPIGEHAIKLMNDINKPDFIFDFSDKFQNTDINKHYPRAADTVLYNHRNITSKDGYIGFIGNYHPDLKQYLFPLLKHVRIFGNGWATYNSVGIPDDKNLPEIFSRARAWIDLNLTNETNDIPFNALSVGTTCISNNCGNIKIPSFNSPEILKKMILDDKIDNTDYDVRSNDTYWHRMNNLLSDLGFYKELQELKGYKNEIIYNR